MNKGLIQVYTGDGKGKTTSAVGLVTRAVAHGLKICFVSFYKDPSKYNYGEFKSLKKLGVDIYTFAKTHPYFSKNISIEKVKAETQKGLRFVLGLFKENKYDIIVLDEILIGLRDKFISENELIDLINKKPEKIELVLTGRGATKALIAKADLVSEIKKIKHPYDKGIQRRKGIEY